MEETVEFFFIHDRFARMSDLALLQVFYGDEASNAHAASAGSLRRLVIEQPLAEYRVQHRFFHAANELMRRAIAEELRQTEIFESPGLVREFLIRHFAGYGEEHFVAFWLSAQHRLVDVDEIFRGTLSQTSVYPREVVRHALACNAAAVVFAHNHPSGVAEPSRADEHLTSTLKSALALIDVRVLDHCVVGEASVVSFAERGLL